MSFTSDTHETSDSDNLEISAQLTEQRFHMFNTVAGLQKRTYVMRTRQRKLPSPNVRGRRNISRAAIRSVRRTKCCDLQHLHSMTSKYILRRRKFFWITMNRTERRNWVQALLLSLTADHVSGIFPLILCKALPDVVCSLYHYLLLYLCQTCNQFVR
jgi:hypothetical protein